jgi:hypothetical protein
MRRLMLALLLAAAPAAAQRPFCEFGTALGALREADAALAAPVASLTMGRERAEAARAALDQAGATLRGCGCPDAAARAAEAALLAARARQEPSAVAIERSMAQARERLSWTQAALGTRGCR